MLRPAPNFSRNVDWNLLKTFHEIAEAGGVSRAGRALRRKQPALSLALKRLEAQLGVTLCKPGPQGFQLTDEGMLVAETCRSLTSLVRNVPKRLGNLAVEVRGRLSIQVMSSLICQRFDTAIARFHRKHPNVEIFLDITTWDAVAAALERSGLDPGVIDEVLFGHVLQAGEGQITARQAAINGGLPMTVPSVTINKVCLSGLSAIGLADRAVRLGDSKFVLAGGMESMSNAPHVVRELRWGTRIGNTQLIDVMQHDGLFCAFDHCTMGESSDLKNRRLGITREEQDDWAAHSNQRAVEATRNGQFATEITPVEVTPPKGNPITVDTDEGMREDTTAETLGGLRPAFVSDGTITAGNASQISDGAAAVVVADRDAVEALGAPVLAEILSYGQIGGADATLHERPAEALAVALKKAGLEVSDLDLVEINEAFAAVSLWAARLLDIPESKVNVNGGAVALGHPLGATGARLVVTLINALRHRGGGIGAATLCGGGGQGDAIVVKVAG